MRAQHIGRTILVLAAATLFLPGCSDSPSAPEP
jgi:hypothetical protein